VARCLRQQVDIILRFMNGEEDIHIPV
jgi:hypothetical protein